MVLRALVLSVCAVYLPLCMVAAEYIFVLKGLVGIQVYRLPVFIHLLSPGCLASLPSLVHPVHIWHRLRVEGQVRLAC